MIRDDQKRAIGKIVSVTADKFVVELHAGMDNFNVVGFDDMHYVARLGSFLMVPVQAEYVVVEIVGLRERDPGQNHHGDGELEKAGSAKFLDVVPVGMLPFDSDKKFRFGVSLFPVLYSDALYALDAELDRIFETKIFEEPSSAGKNGLPNSGATRFHTLKIGKSVVFDGYDVKVNVDDFFGGHAAVLGNTGSGKSCTVSSILQSLFSKENEHYARGATFVIFDVNGEYSQAVSEIKSPIDVEIHELDGSSETGKFRLPHWFLDHSEWELLLQASEKTQMPILRTALGLTSIFGTNSSEYEEVKEHVLAKCIIECFEGTGGSAVSNFHRVYSILKKYHTENLNINLLYEHDANAQFGNYPTVKKLENFLTAVKERISENIELPTYNQKPFSFEDLGECLDMAILYEEAHGNRQIRDYCSQMLTRYKSLSERPEYKFLRHNTKSSQNIPSIQEYYEKLLGLRPNKNTPNGWTKKKQIIIVNMNAVEDDVVELISSVITRMIFQLHRHAEPRNSFPVHLILEEAHRYILNNPSRQTLEANRIFERISKEGRKYGLFLIVASQRPSELSKTVLSQCSNFIIHRIQNPDDLSHIRQMTPFISESVLRRLPSLPKQHALVFGTSVNLATTFKVRDASPLPLSDDAKIRELWFHEEGKPVQLDTSKIIK